MSAAVAQNTRPVQPIDLKISASKSQPATPVGTPDGAPMSAPAKMAKPNKMKKAPRRQSVALAMASPSMLDDAGSSPGVKPGMGAMCMSLDTTKAVLMAVEEAGDAAALPSPKMKKPMKKAGGNKACVLYSRDLPARPRSCTLLPKLRL